MSIQTRARELEKHQEHYGAYIPAKDAKDGRRVIRVSAGRPAAIPILAEKAGVVTSQKKSRIRIEQEPSASKTPGSGN